MHYLRNIVIAITAMVGVNTAVADPFVIKDKSFHEYSWVTTHNAYEKINQNMQALPQQLRDGVRGFMIDLYHKSDYRPEDQIRVCHTQYFCYGPFRNQLANEFIPFLKQNRNEVVSLFLESYVERSHLKTLFEAVPELADLSFDPANFNTTNWPKLSEMVQRNNRLLLFTGMRKIAGDYIVNGKKVVVLFDKDWMAENHWETLGPAASNIEAAHNWSCPSRHDDLPVTAPLVSPGTGKSWSRLFLMNQFHTVTKTIFDSGAYDNNLTYLMRRVNNCGKNPNFIAIDNYRNGDTLPYVQALSQGGIYFWETENASPRQDTVCVLPRGRNNLSLPAKGCENDEIRSMSLSGIDKGTRITLFDNPGGGRHDDYVIIDVLRNIGINEKVVVASLEQSTSNGSYRASFVRNNGLNGKVSRIEVSTTPVDFSDAAIAMYEGNNASQNLDCTVPFDRSHQIKMKSNGYGCSNDEIRSAKILRAKAGTSFTLSGQPDGKSNEGQTTVEILRDIQMPYTIGSFNNSYQDANVKVTHQGKAIDGKISHGNFRGAR